MEQRSGNTATESEFTETSEKLLEDLRQVVEDGEALLHSSSHALSETSRMARERLRQALDSAKETGRRLQQRAAAGTQAADQWVRQHPYPSIGVAFGVGLLIGIIAIRARK